MSSLYREAWDRANFQEILNGKGQGMSRIASPCLDLPYPPQFPSLHVITCKVGPTLNIRFMEGMQSQGPIFFMVIILISTSYK